MGAKLTKSKSISISGKTKEDQKNLTTTVENADNHLDVVTTNETNKQIEKKTKKKKEQKLNKKSSKSKVDKSTNTENYILSSFSEQPVDHQISTVNNNNSLCTGTAQVNVAYQAEGPNKNVQELWNVCSRNGIITNEFHLGNHETSNKQEYQANTLTSTEESTNNSLVTIVDKGDQVHKEKQQQQHESVES